MLNLNYNINKALGGGGCIGVMKYSYSASIVVAGGGGGGGDASVGSEGVGGGGGGAMAVTQSISIVPNITYQINVGAGGAVNSDGQDSYLIGFDDSDTIPISFFAGGGKGATFNGGNSGTGSLVRAGVVTNYTGFTGGTGVGESSGFGPRRAGGGGASNQANGQNGAIESSAANGGDGAAGVTAGGGGGYLGAGPIPPGAGSDGLTGFASSAVGIGGNGSSVGSGRSAAAGSNGAVIISYTGKQKAFVTGNVTTTYVDGITTHTFGSGSGTFLYTYPYPWEEPVTPYQVVLCPPTYQ